MFSFHNFGKNWNDNLITARRWNKTYILIDFHVKTILTFQMYMHVEGPDPFTMWTEYWELKLFTILFTSIFICFLGFM